MYTPLTRTTEGLETTGWTFCVDEVTGDVLGSAEVGARHHTPWGAVNGAVFAFAVEASCSIGASAAVAQRGMFAVGVNNNTDFLRRVEADTLDVIAKRIFQGGTQQLWQATITRRSDGAEVARGRLRLHNLPVPDGWRPPEPSSPEDIEDRNDH